VDVEPNTLWLYESMDKEPVKVPVAQLEFPENTFELFLNKVERTKDKWYIVMLIRPGGEKLVRRIREPMRERDIKIGFEPFETGRAVNMGGVQRGEQEEAPPAQSAVEQPAAKARSADGVMPTAAAATAEVAAELAVEGTHG
jgi:hypothetical protein